MDSQYWIFSSLFASNRMNTHLKVFAISQCMSSSRNPSTQAVEGDQRRLVVQHHPQLHKLEAILEYMRPCLRKQTKALKCKTKDRTLFLTGLRHSSVKNTRHSLAITVIGMTARRHSTAIKHYTTLQKSLKHASTLFCDQSLELSQQALGNSDFFSSLAHVLCLLHILGYFCILHMYA